MALKDNETKMQIKVTDDTKYDSVNVRDENNEILGRFKNGAKVVVTDYAPELERNLAKGRNADSGKNIAGTVLTKCLQPIE
ncbi:MAG: hypothetical protein ACLUFN_10335 [Eubacterium sp.]